MFPVLLLCGAVARLAAGQSEAALPQPELQPYLASFQVEDSCQFQLCGPQFRH